MRSLQGHGRHLLLPEINLVAPPPSPPSMVEPLWGTRASPLWSGLWPCSCVQQSLPLCGVNRVSPHGPVSTRQASLAVLIEPVGRRLLPYTPWRYCRSIRPKHWETCTRVGTTWRFYMSCVLRRTSRSERRRWPHSLWVVRCPRLWSRSAISGCVSLTWRSRRRYSSWMLPCHRPAFSATLSRAVPSSFRQHRSRLRRSSTSCAGGNPKRRRNQVSVTLHTQTPPPAITGQAFTGPGPGPCVPHRCPTTGTSVAPLVPLARSLGAWLALPSPSRWLLRTIRLGYAIQFARRPPKFRGIRFTSVKPADAPVLRAEIAVLLAKDAIEPVPPADMRSGLFSPYFIVPKKGGGLRPILDLRVLNRALHKLPFKMLTQKRIFGCVRPLDWFAGNRPEGRVLSCLDPPATQAIPAFRVRGTGVSVQGPALRAVPVASRLHQSRGGGPCPPERTRCAHSQLPRRLAHTRTVSQAVVCTQGPGAQAPQPAGPSGQLGKEQTRANAEDLFSRHGVRFGQPNSTPHPGTCSVSAELLQDLIRQDGGSTETLSEAPGAYGCSCGDSSARSAPYETASALALWPNPEVSVETRHLPGSDYTGLPQDLQAMVRSLVPSGRSAPGAGIQACCGIHRCLDHRLGSHVQRARSIRGLDGSPTALAYQLPRVVSSTPCPEPSQRAPSAQGRSGPYGQHCDRCVYQPARRFALPSHVATRPPPPPLESEASEVPSCHPHPRSVQSGSRRAVSSSTSRRVETPSPGGSADLGTVRSCSGRPVCISRNHPLPRVLLPNRGNARHGCTGTQLAPGPAQICVPPSEPTSTDTVQDQGGRGAGLVSGSILAQQDLVPGTHAPRDSPSLANSSEEGSAFSETGHPMAPAPGPVETPRMVPGWDAEVLADLPQEVALTITSARAPSTRRAYTLKWNLFVEWCSSHQEDPRRCSIRAVLSFLQQGLERRLSPSTLKVYVAAISAYHDPVEGKSVGKHNLVVRFLRGARRLNPPRPPSLPSWDLALGGWPTG